MLLNQRTRLCMFVWIFCTALHTTALTTLAFTMDSLNAFGKQQRLICSVSFVQTICYSVYSNTVCALTSYVHRLVRTDPFSSLTVRIDMIIQDILFVLHWYQAFQNKIMITKTDATYAAYLNSMRCAHNVAHLIGFINTFETRAAVPQNNSLIRLL